MVNLFNFLSLYYHGSFISFFMVFKQIMPLLINNGFFCTTGQYSSKCAGYS